MNWRKRVEQALAFEGKKKDGSLGPVERRRIAALSEEISAVAKELCERTEQLKKDLGLPNQQRGEM